MPITPTTIGTPGYRKAILSAIELAVRYGRDSVAQDDIDDFLQAYGSHGCDLRGIGLGEQKNLIRVDRALRRLTRAGDALTDLLHELQQTVVSDPD